MIEELNREHRYLIKVLIRGPRNVSHLYDRFLNKCADWISPDDDEESPFDARVTRTFNETIESLIDRGLVTVHEHKRGQNLELTEQGKNAADEIRAFLEAARAFI